MRNVLMLFCLAACTGGDPIGSPNRNPPPQGCDPGLDVGDCAPDFQLLNADGTPIRLADKVGERVVVVGSSLW